MALEAIAEKFWRRVERTPACWFWRGAKTRPRPGGPWYGRIIVKSKVWRAHRLSFLLSVGEIPEGMQVLHLCDTTLCVRPEHLFLGTHADNMRDMKRKGRNVEGHRHPGSKLDDMDVWEIRDRYGRGGVTMKALALKYGINLSTVHGIIRRKRWKHVR